MDSSSALDSYGPVLSNAPSLTVIRAVHAMIQHETSARKLDFFKVKMMLVGFSITTGKYMSSPAKLRQDIKVFLYFHIKKADSIIKGFPL